MESKEKKYLIVGLLFDNFINLYEHLFSLIDHEELEEILISLYNDFNGYYKNNWDDFIYGFHKSLRQADFFNDVFIKKTLKVNNKEINRYKELKKIINEKNFVKQDEFGKFTKEYEEFLNLYGMYKKTNFIDTMKDVSGTIDMIFHNIFSLDKENILKLVFNDLFEDIKLQKMIT